LRGKTKPPVAEGSDLNKLFIVCSRGFNAGMEGPKRGKLMTTQQQQQQQFACVIFDIM
jgi:hypothetical protein